jgi:peptide/nickel transport system substrate-binding protein
MKKSIITLSKWRSAGLSGITPETSAASFLPTRRSVLASLAAAAASMASTPARAQEALTIGIAALPPGLGNPHSSSGFPALFVWPAVFDTLIGVTAEGKPKPLLALGWEAEPPLRWRLALRPGVVFSNGEPFDAAAAAFTLNDLISPEGRAQAAYRDAQTIASARALDPETLIIETRAPDASLPGKLAGIRMLPPRYFAEVGRSGFAAQPVGTGPFVVSQWRGDRIDLVRNPRAWAPPVTQQLRFLPIPEAASRVQALLSGAIDIALNVNPEDRAVIEAAGMRTVLTSRAAILVLQFILERESPLQDFRVRRAISLAVDRAQITQALLAGISQPASQFTVPQALGYEPALRPFETDRAAARALMKEAGFERGFRLPMVMALGSSPNDTSVFQQVAADLAQIGIEMIVRPVPLAQFNRLLFDGQWGETLAFGFHYGSLPSLESTVALRYASCAWMKPYVCDRALSAMIEQAEATFDSPERESLLKAIQRKLVEDLPAVALHETRFVDGLGSRVKRFDAPFGMIDYATLA